MYLCGRIGTDPILFYVSMLQLSMHNLDSFLEHVEDDLHTTSTTTTASGKAKKANNSKNKADVAVVSSQESESTPAVAVPRTKEGKLHGGVNFILADIDTANSLVNQKLC